LEKRKADSERTIKDRQLSETQRHNKATEQIARSKPKTSSK